MTEPDIIRLEGVLYNVTEMGPSYGGRGEMYIRARPKHEQTGWACRECGVSPCLALFLPLGGAQNLKCVLGGNSVWVPFYGKVVEE